MTKQFSSLSHASNLNLARAQYKHSLFSNQWLMYELNFITEDNRYNRLYKKITDITLSGHWHDSNQTI